MTGPEITPSQENTVAPIGAKTDGLISRATSRVKNWFSKPQSTEAFPPIRESAPEILARTLLPNRQVTLEDISIHNIIPIDFAASRRLALAVNQIKATPINQFEVSQLKPPASVHEAIPWAASTIAHHYNPEIPIILPNEQDILAMKPWLKDVSSFLGKFSGRWQYRFGRFIEKKAENALGEATKNVLKRIDTVGQVDHPKARFVPELAQVYKEVTKPEYEDDESFDLGEALGSIFSEESKPRQVRVPIERKVVDLIENLRHAKRGSPYGWINRNSYPLLARAVEITKFPPNTVNEAEAGIAGSEVMSGIETFLKGQGIRDISSPARPVKTFDLFDANTWNDQNIMRSFAETFAYEQILAVKRSLPGILVEVLNLLPESGPELVDAVRILSENVLILSKQGISNAEIAAALFRRPSEESKKAPPPLVTKPTPHSPGVTSAEAAQKLRTRITQSP